MSATQAVIGYNSKFWTGVAGSPIAYTAVAEVNQIDLQDYTVSEIDATHLTSPSSTEEVIPGLIKTGTIDIMGNYIGDSTQQNLDSLAVGRTVFPFKVTTPASGSTTLTVTGTGFFIKMQKGPIEPNKKTEFKATVKVSGVLTYAVA